MSKEELINKLEENSHKQFSIEMVDHWTDYHRKRMKELKAEENQLKKQIAELEESDG